MSKLLFILLFLLIGVMIVFFPVYIETNVYYDINKRKFAFSAHLYKLKLLGGYISTYKGGFALHISKKKAILLPYAQMNKERKRFSFIKNFHLKSFILTTETGPEYFIPVALAQIGIRTYFFLTGGKKEKIKNNVWLTDGDLLRISLNCVLFFNLFLVLRNLLKFLKEKYRKNV